MQSICTCWLNLSGIIFSIFQYFLPIPMAHPHYHFLMTVTPSGLLNHQRSNGHLGLASPFHAFRCLAPIWPPRSGPLLLITNINGNLPRFSRPSIHISPLPRTCLHNEAPTICINTACFHWFHLLVLLTILPCGFRATTSLQPPANLLFILYTMRNFAL